MDVNHADRRRRGTTLAAATLAAALGICTAFAATATATATEDAAAAEWERCAVVSKEALYSMDVHDAFLC